MVNKQHWETETSRKLRLLTPRSSVTPPDLHQPRWMPLPTDRRQLSLPQHGWWLLVSAALPTNRAHVSKLRVRLKSIGELNSVVVSVQDCQRKGQGSNPCQSRNLVLDFCTTCTHRKLSYDEYTALQECSPIKQVWRRHKKWVDTRLSQGHKRT